MDATVLLAWLHLLTLALGFWAILERSRALRGTLDDAGLRRVFFTDNFWGLSAALWLGTGLWRLLAGLDKPIEYYLGNHWFLAKMGAFVVIVALEVWPMATLIRWRLARRRDEMPDTSPARALARIGSIQHGLLTLMVLAAAAMARGFGDRD